MHEPHTACRRRRWLCIAYAFPPISRSGTHRTLGFVRELDRLGWDATVVTARPAETDATDDDLARKIPSRCRVVSVHWHDLVEQAKQRVGRTTGDRVRTTAPDRPRSGISSGGRPSASELVRAGVRDWVTHLLKTPDSRLGWVAPGVRAAISEVRRRRPDVIYSTSPYMSAHLIAMIVAMRTRIAWVADFRDPWRGNPFRRLAARNLDVLDIAMEYAVLRTARHIICNTPTMHSALVARRSFVGRKCSVILNGFDRGGNHGASVTQVDEESREVVLIHCGQFYGPRRPHPWLAALRRANEIGGGSARRIVLELIGPPAYHGTSLEELAREHRVTDQVRVLGVRPHAEVVSRLGQADGLLLAGSEGGGADLQVPNKLFEYLAARRPIIANFGPSGPVPWILRDADARALLCDSEVDGLAWAMRRLAGDASSLEPNGVEQLDGTWRHVDRYARACRARELAALFARLSGRPAMCQVEMPHAAVPTPAAGRPPAASVAASRVPI